METTITILNESDLAYVDHVIEKLKAAGRVKRIGNVLHIINVSTAYNIGVLLYATGVEFEGKEGDI